MKDLVLKFLFKADSSDVKKQIKGIEAQGKKAAEGIGSSLKKAFVGLGSAIAGIGLSRVFKGAIDDAAALEQSLLKLRAAAKNTGQDFDTIEKGLQRLRSEGTLSFQTITEASQQLLQQGFQADDIEPFLRALRNIGALENTVGNTNEAMRSFIRAISTNSIELVDNLSPALRKTVLELGGFNEIAKNADKQQQFINITLERGAQFAEAYGESIETVAGKQAQLSVETEKLSEAFGQALAPAFEETLNVLTPIVQGMTDFLSSLGPTGKSMLAAGAAAVTAAAGFSAMAFAIGAAASAATILTGGLVVAGSALVVYAMSQAAVNKEVNEARDSVEGLQVELAKLSKIKGTERERARLTRELAKAQKVLNDALNDRIAKERNLLSLGEAERKLAISKAQQAKSAALGRLIQLAGEGIRPLKSGEIIALSGTAAQAERLRGGFFGKGVGPFDTSVQRANIAGEQFNILVEQQRVIENLQKASESIGSVGAAAKGAAGGAGEFNSELGNAKRSLEIAVTPLDRYRATLKEIDKQVKNSANTAQTANAAKLAKEAALADAIDETTGDIDNMTDAVETLKDESASAADKLSALGTGLKGFGQTLGTLLDDSGIASKFGVAGAAVGLVGGIAGLISSIFDSPEQEIDPDRIPTILEREREILEKQLDVQKRSLDFQKAQSDAQKKYFEDQIDLARIEAERAGEDPGPKIKELITGELTRLGFEGDETTEQLRAQIDETARLREEKIKAESRLSELQAGTLSLEGSMAIANIYGQRDLVRLAIREFEQGRISQIAMQARITNAAILGASRVASSGELEEQERIQDLLEQSLMITSPLAPSPAPAPQLARAQGRGFGLIDISRGGLQTATGFSVTRGASLAAQAGVPGSIGSLTVATEAMKTTEDKMLDTLNNQLSELKKQTDLLASMTGQDVTMAVLNAMADAETRTI